MSLSEKKKPIPPPCGDVGYYFLTVQAKMLSQLLKRQWAGEERNNLTLVPSEIVSLLHEARGRETLQWNSAAPSKNHSVLNGLFQFCDGGEDSKGVGGCLASHWQSREGSQVTTVGRRRVEKPFSCPLPPSPP